MPRPYRHVDFIDRQACVELASIIMGQEWSSTPQGHSYWQDIFRELQQLGGSGNSSRTSRNLNVPARIIFQEAANQLAGAFDFARVPPSPDYWDNAVKNLRILALTYPDPNESIERNYTDDIPF